MKKCTTTVMLVVMLVFVGCRAESDVVSENMSLAAHNFEINRRCIFYNGITGEYMLTIEGRLTVTKSNSQHRLEVVAKVGPESYKKHYLGLSDNMSYFVEQLDPVKADPFRYRVFFRPTTIIPDIDVQTE